jgi:hypothetical protein
VFVSGDTWQGAAVDEEGTTHILELGTAAVKEDVHLLSQWLGIREFERASGEVPLMAGPPGAWYAKLLLLVLLLLLLLLLLVALGTITEVIVD